MAKKETNALEELSYEQALEELESVVTRLEQEPRDLEEILRLFERGKVLAGRCQVILEQAELKVRMLEPNSAIETDE